MTLELADPDIQGEVLRLFYLLFPLSDAHTHSTVPTLATLAGDSAEPWDADLLWPTHSHGALVH